MFSFLSFNQKLWERKFANVCMSVLFCNDFCSLPFPRKIHGDERKTSERASVTYKRDERARVRHKTHKLSRQPD